jgi:non-heme Fe2+,alpha-ketoglutarate-dependent halogenase
MTALTADETNFYQQNGYLAPIDIFTEDEANALYTTFRNLENDHGDALRGYGRNNVHQVLPLFDQIAHHPRILDIIESLIGPNILVAGTTLFIKEPEQRGFISWHQDARYNGLRPYNWVTAWLALNEVTTENGCMYMWPESHLVGQRDHVDTYGDDNLLTRGQTIMGVPKDKIVPIELRPGQLSVHHPWVVHGSGHNTSKKRRVGLAIQSYIGTEVEQLLGETFVQLARGCDDYNHHFIVPRASGVMVDDEVAMWHGANHALREVLYHEAEKLGRY